MKQTLQLKIGQQLSMTPQLQQAIRLLQLSTLDLQQEIQQALDSNPMLELADDEDSANSEGNDRTLEPSNTVNDSNSDNSQEQLDFDNNDIKISDDWDANSNEELP